LVVGNPCANHDRWMLSTAGAMGSLVENFPPRESQHGVYEGHWVALKEDRFPCQKSDETLNCPGWVWREAEPSRGPGCAVVCPCLQGKKMLWGPLLSVAQEFKKVSAQSFSARRMKLSAFLQCASDCEIQHALLSWLLHAAVNDFPPVQSGEWVSPFTSFELTMKQRQTLRWWARLVELNQLVHNSAFTVLTRAGVEELYQKGQQARLMDVFDQLQLQEGQCVVLSLSGDQLQPPGSHSERLAWLDALLTIIDDRSLGLSLITRQPLLIPEVYENAAKRREQADYRWKARHSAESERAIYSLQSVLRRGAWDRLIEALTRANFLLTKFIPNKNEFGH